MAIINEHYTVASWSGRSTPYPRDSGLAELFAAQVAAEPDAIAVRWEAQRLSYDELDRRGNQMAHALAELGVGEETAVGVYMGQRAAQIVVQVALCKLGATYVPLDPEYPRERLRFMLADAAVAVLVIDERAGADLPGEALPRLCVDRDAGRITTLPEVYENRLAGGAERRTHVLYTSGSTGTPKGIEIVARAISRLVLATNYVQIAPGDRVAQLANFSFDAAIFEVWGPLLNGATTVLLPKSSILDPPEFKATLIDRRISIMFLTTALFNFIARECPDAFQGLKVLLVGGERANPQTMRAVLSDGPPGRFLHAYGPTESTTFTTMHPLDLAEVDGATVPIGAPISNTRVFILDEARRPVGLGEPGELYVGGDGLARGYLNRPELTRERFVEVEDLDDEPLRLYRTGDMAKWRADGAVEFLGRVDFQVKIRGHRIEIEEVEAALLASGLVGGAAIVVHEDALGDKSMVAYVVAPESGRFDAAALKEQMHAQLPAYMVPPRFVEIDGLPLNVNGKIDRKQLAALEQAESARRAAPRVSGGDPLVAELTTIWSQLLGIAEVGLDDDFFRLGGDSLLAARLVMRVREAFHVNFPVYALYESGTLRAFIGVVRRVRDGATISRMAIDGPEVWQADAQLPADIVYTGAQAPVNGLGGARDILLTGATGFLGAFLLRDLVLQTSAQVRCLVRARSEAEGLERLRQGLRKYGLWEERFAARIVAVPGDLRELRLGLSPRVWSMLAHQVDTIFHCGAQVSYVQPYSAHKASNVGGTTEVLRLAGQVRVKPVHYVSTIAVFGPSGYFSGQAEIDEDEPLDAHLEHLRYDIGYSVSKWVAEKLVWAAASRGLPVSVYRPGFIMGHSRTGVGNCDDFMARSIKGCISLGACPDLPAQRKEFVPVDFVSAALLCIATDAPARGRAYHLVPPQPRESVDLNDFFKLLAQCGYPLEVVSYADWVQRLLHDPEVASNALCPLIPMLFERVYRNVASRWELYEHMPAFTSARTSEILAGNGIEYPRMDRALLRKYLDYWLRTGFLAPFAHAAAV